MDEEILLGMLVAFMGFLVFFIVVAIILYVLQAIGLFKIAKREGKSDIAWLAWIPIISQFLMTLLVEDDVHPNLRGKFTLLYGVAFVLSMILSSFVFFVTFIPAAMIFYAFYFIAKRYSTNAVLHLVISIITIGISIPIQLFMFRNRDMIDNDSIITE